MIRIVFLGTPTAAVPTLETVASTYEVGAVVTRPDAPRGRSGRLQPPPVKSAAQGLGLTVHQPGTDEALYHVLESNGPFDLGVVVGYGAILRPAVLELPRTGFLNVHFSLLPRWRGAAPVARALMAGDEMTGVTVIRIDEGLDTGPVLTAQAVDVRPTESSGELTARLARLGARLVAESIEPYTEGRLVPVEQVENGATRAAKISASDRPLSSGMAPLEFVNRVRGLAPSPGATLGVDGVVVKILGAVIHSGDVEPGTWADIAGAPVVGVDAGGVEIRVIQPPGRRPMSGADWLRGLRRSGGVVG
jgi:methionyl-tRNA formyltransferase